MSPKVSIIMPVYNKALYLQRTFDALVRQEFKDWELIVIDDGSTDESQEIIEKYVATDHRIRNKRQKNQGASQARNEGLKLACGEWIWFVDADDLPSYDFLNKAFSVKNDDDAIDLIIGFYSKMFPDGKMKQVHLEEQGVVSSKEIPDLFIKYQYETGYWGYLWNKLIRRSIIIENHLQFQIGLTLAEDLKFMISVYRNCQSIYILPESAMIYMIGTQNSSSEKKIDYPAQLLIHLEIYRWIVEEQGCDEYATFLRKQITYYVAFSIFYGFEEKNGFLNLAQKFAGSSEIYPLLDPRELDLVMKPIIYCVKWKWWGVLKLYLYGRDLLRRVYRHLRKKR